MEKEEIEIKNRELYENGKHRRYSLLFAVNGAAFAIAKILTVKTDGTFQNTEIGGLSVETLSFGVILFTIVMGADILFFGLYSKGWNLEGEITKGELKKGWLEPPFALPGLIVLILLTTLICVGWGMIGKYNPSQQKQPSLSAPQD